MRVSLPGRMGVVAWRRVGRVVRMVERVGADGACIFDWWC